MTFIGSDEHALEQDLDEEEGDVLLAQLLAAWLVEDPSIELQFDWGFDS